MKKIVTIAAIAATLVSCSGGGGRPTFGDNEYPVVTVGTSQADMQTTYPASIKGVQDVEIRPKAQGFLTQINVKEGQTVSAGQVLFVIDNETYQAQVRQAQAAVNAAQQQCNTAKLTYNNAQQLHAKKVIGDYELQTSQNTFESAQAQERPGTVGSGTGFAGQCEGDAELLLCEESRIGCCRYAALQEGCFG